MRVVRTVCVCVSEGLRSCAAIVIAALHRTANRCLSADRVDYWRSWCCDVSQTVDCSVFISRHRVSELRHDYIVGVYPVMTVVRTVCVCVGVGSST